MKINLITKYLLLFILTVLSAKCISQNLQNNWFFNTGTVNYETMTAMTVDGDGNTIIVGTYEDSIRLGNQTFRATFQGDFGYIAKINAQGDFLWAKEIKSAGGADLLLSDVETDADGNIYVFGWFFPIIFPNSEDLSYLFTGIKRTAFYATYDTSGNHIASNSYFSSNIDLGFLFGTIGSNGDLWMGGYSDLVENSVDLEPFLLQANTNGEIIQNRIFITVGPQDVAVDVVVTESGFYFLGHFGVEADLNLTGGTNNYQSVNGNDFFVIKSNLDWEVEWVYQAYSDLEGGIVIPSAIVIDENENLYISGTYSGRVDFNFGSDPQYLQTSSPNTFEFHSFLVKINKNKEYQWSLELNGFDATDLAMDSNGNVFALTSGNDDTVQKISAMGDLKWNQNIPDFIGKSIQIDQSDNILLAGEFSGDFFYNLDEGMSISSFGSRDLVVLSYSESNTTNTDDLSMDDIGINIFPNPASHQITITNDSDRKLLQVLDMNGRIMMNRKIPHGISDIPIELTPGNYIFNFNQNGIPVNKMIQVIRKY